ncbi:MAG TPA: helix-turn-helix domain-containing protein [Kribbella sp.]|nr:helix-turn-helix domain-containing protein [Kribbella sp.]
MSGPESMDPASVVAVATLADEVRRSLFHHVRRSADGLTREQAAAAAGISRKLAAFHLDKLVAVGLLVARTGGGTRRVGRRPKLYTIADSAIQVSIPSRRTDLLSGMLVAAVAHHRPDENAAQAARRVAHQRGCATGAAERESHRPGRLGAERALSITHRLLERLGYQPARAAVDCLLLKNCPFHPQAVEEPELVCGINHAYVTGLLDGLQATSLDAVLAPAPEHCCVEVRRRYSDRVSGLSSGARARLERGPSE